MERTQAELDRRWDIHTERQAVITRAGILATTVLNSGSWLALLTQVSDLQDKPIGLVLGLWGLGAFFGTLIWLFLYLNASRQMLHDFDRDNEVLRTNLHSSIWYCVAPFVLSLLCFVAGVIMLACNLM